MADHVRKQLREAVATAVTGLTTTATRVFQSRAYPVRPAELPCLLVYVDSESAEDATIHGDTLLRRLQVRIEGLAQASADLDDTLDLIAKEVETALASAVSIASTTTDLGYTGAEIEIRDDLEKPTGSIVLSFDASLFTTGPDTIVGA